MFNDKALIFAAFFIVAISVFSGGCHSDLYYHNRAANRAREFLIENARELSAEEKYFITFNDPVFLTSPIIGSKHHSGERSLAAPVLSDELKQICVAWKIPGREELYMVYGTSNDRMNFWYPDRVICKRFASPRASGLELATGSSRAYAKRNLFDLMNVAEQNFVRFHFPAVYETDFELNFNPDGSASDKDVASAREAAAKAIQYSLVWAVPGAEELTVFCGIGKAEMQGWKINFAGKISAEELRRHTIKQIKTPEAFYAPFPVPYAKEEKK